MIKRITKSEWLEFDFPLAEPDVKWLYNYGYQIERRVDSEGETIWYGQGTNWKKTFDGPWTVLARDENVEPISTEYNNDGSVAGNHWPENAFIWKECDEPLYETLYKSRISTAALREEYLKKGEALSPDMLKPIIEDFALVRNLHKNCELLAWLFGKLSTIFFFIAGFNLCVWLISNMSTIIPLGFFAIALIFNYLSNSYDRKRIRESD